MTQPGHLTTRTEFVAPHRARVTTRTGRRASLPQDATHLEFDLNAYGHILRAWAHRPGGRVTDLSDELYAGHLEVT